VTATFSPFSCPLRTIRDPTFAVLLLLLLLDVVLPARAPASLCVVTR
jgi:hypothetical protein